MTRRITTKDIIQRISVVEWMTVVVFAAAPLLLHYGLFPNDDKLSLIMDWLSISGIVIAFGLYVFHLHRKVRRAVAQDGE
jgi:magnesium-transporting ATPase (P-type)